MCENPATKLKTGDRVQLVGYSDSWYGPLRGRVGTVTGDASGIDHAYIEWDREVRQSYTSLLDLQIVPQVDVDAPPPAKDSLERIAKALERIADLFDSVTDRTGYAVNVRNKDL